MKETTVVDIYNDKSGIDVHGLHKQNAWGTKPPEYKEENHKGWDDFTQNTTFHGVKYIFDRKTPFKSRR